MKLRVAALELPMYLSICVYDDSPTLPSSQSSKFDTTRQVSRSCPPLIPESLTVPVVRLAASLS